MIGFSVCPDCRERYFTADGHKCRAGKKQKRPLKPIDEGARRQLMPERFGEALDRAMGASQTLTDHEGPVTTTTAPFDPNVEVSTTYKYRDPVKRREQVRLAMQRYRQRLKEAEK